MRNRSQTLAVFCGTWLVLGGASGALAGPAEGEVAAPSEADGASVDEASADEASVDEVSDEAPASEGEGAAGEAPAQSASAPVSVSKSQRDLEDGMATLGALAAEAKRDSDLIRAECVLDKQERAQGVMELATDELLVIRDPSASAQARSFAAEKLAAAAERLDELVEEAKVCVGDATPEEEDDETRNESTEEQTVPIADATVGGRDGGAKPFVIPPPVDGTVPPSVGSPSF